MSISPLDPALLNHPHARHVGDRIGDIDKQRPDVSQFLANLIQGYSPERAPKPNGLVTLVCDKGLNACGYFHEESFQRLRDRDGFSFVLTHWEGPFLNIARVTILYRTEPSSGAVHGEIHVTLFTNPPDPKARGCVAETEFIEA